MEPLVMVAGSISTAALPVTHEFVVLRGTSVTSTSLIAMRPLKSPEYISQPGRFAFDCSGN